MFRFPRGMLNDETVAPYLIEALITWETHGDFQVLTLDFYLEESAGWVEVGAGLSDFITLRADLMEGDFRLLYLAWLKGRERVDEDWRDQSDEALPAGIEPPVPPGLQALTPGLSRFIDLVELDRFKIEAAAEQSVALAAPSPLDYHNLVRDLSRAECDRFLAAIANGEPGAVDALRRQLRPVPAPQPRTISATARTYDQLQQRAQVLAAAERQALAAEASQKHAAAMEAVALRKEAVWEEIGQMLDHGRRNATVYAEATDLLTKLAQLAEYQGREVEFHTRLLDLAERYARRPALLGRWREQGLL